VQNSRISHQCGATDTIAESWCKNPVQNSAAERVFNQEPNFPSTASLTRPAATGFATCSRAPSNFQDMPRRVLAGLEGHWLVLERTGPDLPALLAAAAAGHEINAYRIRSAKISTIPICPVIQHAGLTPIGPKA